MNKDKEDRLRIYYGMLQADRTYLPPFKDLNHKQLREIEKLIRMELRRVTRTCAIAGRIQQLELLKKGN